jgi:SAM-dependent methyltransferase
MSDTTQQAIDERNAAFWDELCGSALAQSIGVTDNSPESLRRFDEAYLERYPYLLDQLPQRRSPGERLLEIGLGYGTVSQKLAEAGFDYRGLDIAAGPVEIVRERLRRMYWGDVHKRVTQGSALEIPYRDATFDHVVSIGCLHHTGDLGRAVQEVHRVLRPGGEATIMLYNRHSARLLALRLRSLLRRQKLDEQRLRAAYDVNAAGDSAPQTTFTTVRQVRQELFAGFSDVRIERHNFDETRLIGFRGRAISLSRERALKTVARVLGTDLYIHARK